MSKGCLPLANASLLACGANRPVPTSLAELVVFCRPLANKQWNALVTAGASHAALDARAADIEQRLKNLVNQKATKTGRRSAMRWVCLCGRSVAVFTVPPELMQKTVGKTGLLQGTLQARTYSDTSSVFNTCLLYTIGIGHGLNVAEMYGAPLRWRVKSPAARISV